MSDRDLTRDLLPAMAEARARFMELVAEVRPELHRYCARMTGNVFDGEDIVQDTLAKAYFALSEMGEPPPLRGWLFRIAHNTAIDFLRRYERKNVDLVADVPDVGESEDYGPDPALVEAALAVFVSLPPVQRSAIVLKDVLGHSLEETASTMGTTVPAVKGALVRAREHRRERLIEAEHLGQGKEEPSAVRGSVQLARLGRVAGPIGGRSASGYRVALAAARQCSGRLLLDVRGDHRGRGSPCRGGFRGRSAGDRGLSIGFNAAGLFQAFEVGTRPPHENFGLLLRAVHRGGSAFQIVADDAFCVALTPTTADLEVDALCVYAALLAVGEGEPMRADRAGSAVRRFDDNSDYK